MWQLLRFIAPYMGGANARIFLNRFVSAPIAIIFGTIGYFVEGQLSDRYTPANPTSIATERVERLVEEECLKSDPTVVDSLTEKKFVPKTVFERNVAPSLQNKEN